MRRYLLIVLAALYLMGPKAATPAYAGSCPQQFYTLCEQECQYYYSLHCLEPCYDYDQTGIYYIFSTCDSGVGGGCYSYSELGCNSCCR